MKGVLDAEFAVEPGVKLTGSLISDTADRTGDRLLQEANLIIGGATDGLRFELRNAMEHPGRTAAELAAAAGASAGLAFLQRRAGALRLGSQVLSGALAYTFLADTSGRVRVMKDTLADSWLHPANLEQNRDRLSRAAGPLALATILSVAGILGLTAGRKLSRDSGKIPHFDSMGFLPPGEYPATWSQFCSRFGTNGHRQQLLRGLHTHLSMVAESGGKTAYVGGSFVTGKRIPADYDAVYSLDGVDFRRLKATEMGRLDAALIKTRYGGELFPNMARHGGYSGLKSTKTWLEFFKFNERVGRPVGVVHLDLNTLSQ